MRCQEVRSRLDDRPAGEDSWGGYGDIQEHLATCPACARYANAQEQLSRYLRDASASDCTDVIALSAVRSLVESRAAQLRHAHKWSTIMSRITHSLRRPIYLIPSTVAVVALIALTLFPWKVDQPGGYHVAFAGVDKDLALQKYGVQRVLQRLGISDADVEVGDCEASCNLVIRELRDEAEVGKVVSAMFQLSDCELLEVSRDGEVCLNIPGQKSITFDENGNVICDFTSDLSDDDRVLVEIAVREVCFSAGDGGELNLNDCLSAKTVNITDCTIPCGPPQNLEGWSDEAATRGDTLKLTLSVCGKPGLQEIGGTGVYVGDLPATASSDPAPSQDKSSASINGFQLNQNYPNPFNAATTIVYNVPEGGGNVTLEIYNINGQLVKTLVDRHESAGSHEITWDATDSRGNSVASGMYLYRLTAGSYVETKKMSLLK